MGSLVAAANPVDPSHAALADLVRTAPPVGATEQARLFTTLNTLSAEAWRFRTGLLAIERPLVSASDRARLGVSAFVPPAAVADSPVATLWVALDLRP